MYFGKQIHFVEKRYTSQPDESCYLSSLLSNVMIVNSNESEEQKEREISCMYFTKQIHFVETRYTPPLDESRYLWSLFRNVMIASSDKSVEQGETKINQPAS